MKFFAGIVDPETLAAIDSQPQGELSHSAGQCSALEIRYDLFLEQGMPVSELAQIAPELRAKFPETLLIGTLRLERDGGSLSDALVLERERFIRAILSGKNVPDLLDIEIENLSVLLPKISAALENAGARVLASHHDFSKVPEVAELERLVATAKKFGACGFKAACAQMEGDFEPVYPLILRESENFEYFSLFAMGDLGRESRIQSLCWGANLTYCALRKAVAPGQLSVEDALAKYREKR